MAGLASRSSSSGKLMQVWFCITQSAKYKSLFSQIQHRGFGTRHVASGIAREATETWAVWSIGKLIPELRTRCEGRSGVGGRSYSSDISPCPRPSLYNSFLPLLSLTSQLDFPLPPCYMSKNTTEGAHAAYTRTLG